MDFQNPKVRQAVFEHIQFAVSSVEAVLPMERDKSFETTMSDNMKLALVAQILSFTLARDYKLVNTMNEIRLSEGDIKAGRKLEDLLLP